MQTFAFSLTFLLPGLAFSQAPASKAPAYPADVRVEPGVAFLPADRAERADLYFPKEMAPGKRYPAVVMIHGGGFTGGQRDAARELNVCGNLARNGYVAMSVDYLLSRDGQAVWPKNLHDCKTAVRWLRKEAARLQIDADYIGVIGGSAGGHLAAMVTLTDAKDGLDPAEPYGEFNCRVQCGVDLYGPSDFTSRDEVVMLGKKREEDPELYRRASPVTYASAGDPPLLIVHGTADKTVPVLQSELLAAALKKAGAPHALEIVPDAPHTFHLQPAQRDLRPLVIGFFDRHLKPKEKQ